MWAFKEAASEGHAALSRMRPRKPRAVRLPDRVDGGGPRDKAVEYWRVKRRSPLSPVQRCGLEARLLALSGTRA